MPVVETVTTPSIWSGVRPAWAIARTRLRRTAFRRRRDRRRCARASRAAVRTNRSARRGAAWRCPHCRTRPTAGRTRLAVRRMPARPMALAWACSIDMRWHGRRQREYAALLHHGQPRPAPCRCSMTSLRMFPMTLRLMQSGSVAGGLAACGARTLDPAAANLPAARRSRWREVAKLRFALGDGLPARIGRR